MKTLMKILKIVVFLVLVYFAFFWHNRLSREAALNKIIDNLKADTKIAEVLVTDSKKNAAGEVETTIKFLEYGLKGTPLKPKYFTFKANIIQFQALVVRFDDIFVEKKDRIKGRSAYLFTKVFALDGAKTAVFDIAKAYETPEGYSVEGVSAGLQNEIWKRFWKYVLDPSERGNLGIKNAQIEAPGSLFVPGTIYTIKIEHDGGIWIDTRPIPTILKGETIK